MVENQYRKRIKVIQLDNGGEYTSDGFVDFCSEAGIKREFTILYNPWKNGVAEWKNMTIISVVKEIIHDQGVSMFLWAQACSTMMLHNKMPPSPGKKR